VPHDLVGGAILTAGPPAQDRMLSGRSLPPHTLDGILWPMTCPECGQEERQERNRVLGTTGALTLHRECTSGHAWHLPLVMKPETRPAACDCEAET
jgi:hypothetical protein